MKAPPWSAEFHAAMLELNRLADEVMAKLYATPLDWELHKHILGAMNRLEVSA